MSLGFTNQNRARQYFNSAKDMFHWTMTNLDEATKNARNGVEPDEFKAVCLSGIQDQDVNSTEERGHMKIIVRPITQNKLSPHSIPTPLDFTNADEINKIISMHGSIYTAKSNFDYKDHSAIKFGQIIICKFHRGDPPGDLRFEEPNGITLVKEYLDLAAIEGVAAGSLFTPPGQWPGGIQTIINGVTAAFEFIGNFMGGDGNGGGGGTGGPPNTEAFRGGNNPGHPRDHGFGEKSAGQEGLGWNFRPRKTQPNQIILHCTAGGSNMFDMLSSQNARKGPALNYHYVIDRNGEFTQAVHPANRAAHAGKNDSIARYGYSLGLANVAIGVCACNFAGDAYNRKPGASKTSKSNQGGDQPNPISGKDAPRASNGGSGPDPNWTHAGYVLASTYNFDDKEKIMYQSSGTPRWHERYPQVVMDRFVDICAVLCLKYGIDVEQIYTHQMIKIKGDPGGTFHVDASKQGIEYDPNLVAFKAAVRAKMPHWQNKQLKKIGLVELLLDGTVLKNKLLPREALKHLKEEHLIQTAQ